MKKMMKRILFLSLALGIILAPEAMNHSNLAQDPGGGGMGKVETTQDPGGGGMG
jgi:hypothetical protein